MRSLPISYPLRSQPEQDQSKITLIQEKSYSNAFFRKELCHTGTFGTLTEHNINGVDISPTQS